MVMAWGSMLTLSGTAMIISPDFEGPIGELFARIIHLLLGGLGVARHRSCDAQDGLPAGDLKTDAPKTTAPGSSLGNWARKGLR